MSDRTNISVNGAAFCFFAWVSCNQSANFVNPVHLALLNFKDQFGASTHFSKIPICLLETTNGSGLFVGVEFEYMCK